MTIVQAAEVAPWLVAVAAVVSLSAAVIFGICCCLKSKSKPRQLDEECAEPIRKRSSLRSLRSTERLRVDEEDEDVDEGHEEHVYEDVQQQRKRSKTWFTRRDSKQRELSAEHLAALSVKERITQLEKDKHSDANISKPKRKKPTNQAFQEFEKSGILISFGQVPKKQIPTESDDEKDIDSETYEKFERFEHQTPLQLTPKNSAPKTLIQQTVRQEDLAAVTRETELLKSFRKPPPPKNRSRARRNPTHHAEQNLTAGLESPLETEEDISSIKTSPSRDMTDFSSTDSGIDNTQSTCSHSLPDFLSKNDELGRLNKTRSVEDCADEAAPPRRLSGILSDSRNLLCAPQVSALLVKDFMQDSSTDDFNVISIHLNPLDEDEGKESPDAVTIPQRPKDSHGMSKSAPSGNTEELIRKFTHLSHSPEPVTYIPDSSSMHGRMRRTSREDGRQTPKSKPARRRSSHHHNMANGGRVHDALIRLNIRQEPTHV